MMERNRKLKIGLIFNKKPGELSILKPQATINGPQAVNDKFAEWDSEETIEAVAQSLRGETEDAKKREVVLIEANENCFNKLLNERPDLVFNMAEGFNGSSREAQIPAILEMLQIPYTGSDPVTLGICLDKQRTKEILSFHNILTPRFSIATSSKNFKNGFLPCVVKPVWEGSSKGIVNNSLVRTRKELIVQVDRILSEYNQPALIEEFLEGREFTVSIMGNGDRLLVLPIVEIKFDTLPPGINKLYSYEAKWIWDKPETPLEIFECPAKIDSKLEEKIKDMCCNAFNIFHCRDWCRIDVRLDKNGEPHILELNPLPGILPKPEDNSCLPKAARAAGITYTSLVNMVVTNAIERYPSLAEKLI